MRGRLLFLVLWTLLVTGGHFSLGVGSHRQHLVHILLTGLYLVPIQAAALWWGLRGGLTAALAIDGIYLVHMVRDWAGQPMENANQAATLGVFLLLGSVSGTLSDRQERERQRRLREEARAQREAVVQGLASLGNALRRRDETTSEHCGRVAALAVRIGRRLNLAPERLDLLRLAALAHDIGKIGVRDDILLKPEELTPEERQVVERHPAFAAEILRPIRGVEEISEIVLSHHECPDGSGYPRHLADAAILLEARILRVADVFDALTEARQYKPSREAGDVLAEMHEWSGTKLDGECLRALEESLQSDSIAGADLE
ncbi:MAG TPA: HD domain-containing phosphohydrolase [Holophagaceae bacterium]|nr:HD domain-containing phosphohydrolase [Holophagaceae bacterium]